LPYSACEQFLAEKPMSAPNQTRANDLAFAGFLGVSFIALWKPLSELIAFSFAHEYCSHIILIPFVSGWFLYTNWSLIRSASRTWFPGALIAAVPVLLLFWTLFNLSTLDEDNFLAGVMACIVCLWIAGFAVCYGPRALRVALFPMLFLFFTVPLPTPVLHQVTYFLQAGSTDITEWLLQLSPLPILREGFIIHTPTLTILVAEECSGIRSSLALLITCLIAAQLMLKSNSRRLIFILLTFPVALIKNGIRIAVLVLLSVYVDMRFMTSSLHRDGGILFFILALFIMLPFLKLLQKSESSSSSPVRKSAGIAKEPLRP
jgi:exosortase